MIQLQTKEFRKQAIQLNIILHDDNDAAATYVHTRIHIFHGYISVWMWKKSQIHKDRQFLQCKIL